MSSTSDSTSEHFDSLASRYAELRTDETFDRAVIARAVELGALSGRRVLDVGCGPGATVRRLASEFGVEAVGVDPSERMIETARAGGGEFHVGGAEALPFQAGSFDAATMRMVAHLLDRPRAFAEIRRVLRPDGRLVITTIDPRVLDSHWLTAYFPSYASIDRARFPNGDGLERQLHAADFSVVKIDPYTLHRSLSREEALAKIRGRAYSTFALMSDDEYKAGIEAAELRLPDAVDYEARLLNVAAFV